MNEMIERAAKAAFEVSKSYSRLGWMECSEQFQETKRREARAMIEALREPTEAMVEASYDVGPLSSKIAWQAMIDSILEPVLIGVDLSSGPDIYAEIEYKILPDGTREIVSVKIDKSRNNLK